MRGTVDHKIVLRYAIREVLGTAVAAVALFWAAGRIDWWGAWALLALLLAWATATAWVILRLDPSLLAERLGPRKGGKTWDTALMSIFGLATLARLIVAGLDQRQGWGTGVPLVAQIVALVVCALGYALVVWATASNAYFSQIVRVQSERGHTVATGEPYRTVRLPAYVGTILCELGTPFLLGSWWALIPSGLNAVLLLVRTALEDRTLQAELEGYADYARQVRYRLIPGIW